MAEQNTDDESERTVVDPFAAPPGPPHPWGEQDRWSPPAAPQQGAPPWGPPTQAQPSAPPWGPPTQAQPSSPPWGPPTQAQPSAPPWGPPPQHPGPWAPSPQQQPGRWGPPGQPHPYTPAWAPPPAGRRDPWAGHPLVGEERTWVPAVHWLPLLTTWLGPMVVLLTVGERNARVRQHALDSLNFEITFWLGMLVSALLTWVLVGYLFLALLPILALVQRIIAAVETSRGRRHRYALSLRFVR